MQTYSFIKKNDLGFSEKPRPTILERSDAIVRVTVASICSSDLHIKHGHVQNAVPGVTLGHEMVGIVEEIGKDVKNVAVGDRVCVNVETFCGSCFFCKNGYVNNCTHPQGGWSLGCRIDGGQAEYVRVPFADTGLTKIPAAVNDFQALFVGDILATGFWATKVSEIKNEDTVLIIGAGPTGICCLLCALLKKPKRIIVCDSDENRIRFVNEHYPTVLTVFPDSAEEFVKTVSDHNGADVVIEAAGGSDTFEMAWQCARPNAIVTIVALYDRPQLLPLPQMYGKNLIFKTGGVDACNGSEIIRLIEKNKLDTMPLITHVYPFDLIDEAYKLFENKEGNVMKIAVEM